MNFDIDSYIAFAEHTLTAQRFRHSMGVMQVIVELAPTYGLNTTTAMAAGILHDIAKEFTPEDLLKFANENNIPIRMEYDRFPLFLHGPVGACYAAQQFGITDAVLLDAIARHTYFGNGIALSPSLCWCLRFADMLEPSRDWEDLKSQLRPFAYSGNMGEGAYQLMKWIVPFHQAASLPVHPNVSRLAEELSKLKDAKKLDELNNLPV
jgi:predicted HD superfamily hydrolase involved in NAD metabolism